MSGRLRKWGRLSIATCLFALGSSLCYEVETEYELNIDASDDQLTRAKCLQCGGACG